ERDHRNILARPRAICRESFGRRKPRPDPLCEAPTNATRLQECCLASRTLCHLFQRKKSPLRHNVSVTGLRVEKRDYKYKDHTISDELAQLHAELDRARERLALIG